MIILVPPSEGKVSPAAADARPLDLSTLNFPALAGARQQVISVLMKISGQPDALKVLKVGASIKDAVRRNQSLLTRPAAPALDIYSGVLYGALNSASFTPRENEVAESSLLISSALFGVVMPGDRIPDYRCSMGVSLPGLGGLATWWKPSLNVVLNNHAAGKVILDARSGPYSASWPLLGELAENSVQIRVFREVEGKRTVVSHNAKHARGLVARYLIQHCAQAANTPGTVAEAFDIIRTEFHAELNQVEKRGCKQSFIDVIEHG